MCRSERVFEQFVRQRVLLQLGMYEPGVCLLICAHGPAGRYLRAGARGFVAERRGVRQRQSVHERSLLWVLLRRRLHRKLGHRLPRGHRGVRM